MNTRIGIAIICESIGVGPRARQYGSREIDRNCEPGTVAVGRRYRPGLCSFRTLITCFGEAQMKEGSYATNSTTAFWTRRSIWLASLARLICIVM
jgi:hypothetical protein